MPSYRDGLEAIPSVIAQLNADNIVATIEAANVGAYLYGFDGTTWDRITATGGLMDVNTELPAAAALADNAANPTTPLIGAALLYYDGTTWDRARGRLEGGLAVEGPHAVSDVVTPRPFAVGGIDASDAIRIARVIAPGDAVASPAHGLVTIDLLHSFNGTTWDRMRGDTTNGLDVDVTRVTGTVTVDTELAAAAALSDTFANPTTAPVGACLLVWSGAEFARAVGVSGDANSPVVNLRAQSLPYLYNGASFDRARNNEEVTVLTSAARTATTSSAILTNYNSASVVLYLNITANPGGAETLTVSVNYEDPVAAAVRAVTAFVAEAAATNGLFVYVLGLGAVETLAVTGLQVQGICVPRNFSVTITHSAAGSWTYSASLSYSG